jgi:hypothetical protein
MDDERRSTVEDTQSYTEPFTLLGLALILSGFVLVLIPFIARYLPSLKRLPWFILWVYRSDGFFFATSPLLIALSLVWVILNLFLRGR